MLFSETLSYPRLYELHYSTPEEFVKGLINFEGKIEETFAEHPDYMMEMDSYITEYGFTIKIKVSKIK